MCFKTLVGFYIFRIFIRKEGLVLLTNRLVRSWILKERRNWDSDVENYTFHQPFDPHHYSPERKKASNDFRSCPARMVLHQMFCVYDLMVSPKLCLGIHFTDEETEARDIRSFA